MLPLHLLFLLVCVWAGGEKTYLVKTGEPKSCDVSKHGCKNCTESDCTRENGCLWTKYTDSPDGPVFGFCDDHTVISPETDGPEHEMDMEVESDIKGSENCFCNRMRKHTVCGEDGVEYDTCTVRCAGVKIKNFGKCPKKGPCSGDKHGEICEKIGTSGELCRGPWPACGKKTGLCMYDVCKVFHTEPCSGKMPGDVCEVEGVSGPVCRGFWPHCGKKTGLCLNNVCKVFRTEPCAGKKKGDVCEVEGTAGPWCRSIWPACGKRTGRCTGPWGDVCKLENPGSGSDCSKRKDGAVCDPLCKAAFCKPNTGRCRKKRCVFVGQARPVARG